MTIPSPIRKLTVIALGTACVALGTSQSVHAASITTSTDTALSGANVIDFESVSPSSFSSQAFGNVTFSTSGNEVGFIGSDYAGQYNTQGQSLQNTYALNAFNLLKISFANSVSAFGFNWGASDVTWNLQAFDSANNLIDSFTIPSVGSSNAGDFFGIKTNSSNISYATLTASSPYDYVFIDNFKSTGATAVPTPALLPGLIGLGFGVLRKRKAQAANQTSEV